MRRKNEDTVVNPAACSLKPRESTPPNRYAPATARIGFQPEKTTSARAIHPRPATMFSIHVGVYARDRYAPPREVTIPPNTVARNRTLETSTPTASAAPGSSPTARVRNPTRVRNNSHQSSGDRKSVV